MRTTAFFLALAAGVLVLCLVASASAVSPSVWHPLGTDFHSLAVPPETPQSATPAPVAVSVATSKPSARPRPSPTRAYRYFPASRVAGIATYYQWHAGQAAAARALRDFLGAGWRGTVVRVCHDGLCLQLRLTDYESSLIPGRLIDLDSSDFRRICGPLSRGVCDVTVSRG